MSTHRNLRSDYLSGESSLAPFYQYPPTQPDFGQIARDKSADNVDRQLLATVIREQYEGLDRGEAVDHNLERLAQEDSFTITTGHQLVLFGGPMFTVYKIISVIKLAEQLTASGMNVVPVFWIHTEDHDFEEINHYFLDFQTKKTYKGAFKTMVGAHVLEPSIEEVQPATLPESLSRAFRGGKTLASAFREFFHELFGKYGLLMLDAADPRLKGRFSGVLKRELTEHFASKEVEQTSSAMEEAGYSLQIHPREINLFYLDEQGRNRIVQDGDQYKVLDRDLMFSRGEILEMAEDSPEKFSPNVSLRPLYQEIILPNLAYIGGWGELSYWLQLKGVFGAAGVNFPLLLPRMSATLLTKEQSKAWSDLGFSLPDVTKPTHELYDAYLPRVWDATEFEAYEAKILSLIDALEGYVKEDVSETLARSADALSTKTRKYLDNLEKKAGKIKRQQHQEPFDKIKGLKQEIQPDRMVQERVLSLASFARTIPPQELVDLLHDCCDPLNLDHQFRVLP